MTQSITEAVQEKYAAVAVSDLTSDHSGVHAIAEAFGYSAEELASIPAEANMGLSCGNPTATAHLKSGEVVVDLGSGGGLDVFLAAHQVGPTGKAIGVDMTPEMVERANRAAEKQGLTNVEFHLGTIDKTPLPDNSVDCVISNCVINLATDKPAVFREIFRMLKPGGRVAISDIALTGTMPPEIGENLLAYIGCIAGAIPVGEYVAGLISAGFSAVQVIDTKKDLNAYSNVENQAGCCAPPSALTPEAKAGGCSSDKPSSGLKVIGSTEDVSSCCEPSATALHEDLAALIRQHNLNDFAASVQVYAIKP